MWLGYAIHFYCAISISILRHCFEESINSVLVSCYMLGFTHLPKNGFVKRPKKLRPTLVSPLLLVFNEEIVAAPSIGWQSNLPILGGYCKKVQFQRNL